MTVGAPAVPPWSIVELRKLSGFLRRDLLTMWSYRLALVSDWVNLILQVALFAIMDRLVDASKIPAFGGRQASYLEFVVVGIAFASIVQVSLGRVVSAIRNEQLMGTLESLLVTPTSPAVMQLGSVVYDLLYVPLRTAVFLTLMTAVFGLHLHLGGVLPAVLILVLFVPFGWGLGVLSAAAVLTMRRGSGIAGLVGTMLTLASGAYFPVGVLPGWLQRVAEVNPLTVAVEGARDALLGGAGWEVVGRPAAVLLPLTVVSISVGGIFFRAAIQRERRRGTLFLY